MSVELTRTADYSGNSAEVITFRLYSKSVDELLDRLVDVLSEFQDWNDYLSTRLYEWGSQVISLESNSNLDIEKFQQVAKENLETLQMLLKNPMTKVPLMDPVLDPEWVWERQTLEDYRNEMSPISPFTNEKIEVIPHLFAKAMIDWLGEAKQKSGVSTEISIALNPSSLSAKVNREFALFFFSSMAQKYVKEKNQYMLQIELENQCRQLAAMNQELSDRVKKETKRVEENIVSHENQVNARVEGLKSTMMVRVDHLIDQADSLKKTLGEEKDENRKAVIKIKELNTSCDQLRASYNQLQQRVSQAESNGGGGGGCVIL